MSELRNEADAGNSRAVLAGIRVADFSRVLAGPYATMMLADFGADVIKIESVSGDDTRQWTPPVDADGLSTYFGSVNRNKRSVVCDLNTPSGLTTARRLAESADVIVENFRPGVMEHFGLHEALIRTTNPGVVYCSITGFGKQAGASLPGYDLLVQAVGGLMSITGEATGAPSKVGVALVDVLTGLNAVTGVLLALRARERSGRGERVDVDLMTTLLSALTNQAASTLATGVEPPRLGNAHPSIASYEVFMAADRSIVIAVGNDRQFRALAEALGVPALAKDERFATNDHRVRNRESLRTAIETALASADAAHWVGRLTTARVPAGLVNSVGEAFACAESLGLDAVVKLADAESGRSTTQVGNPIHLTSHPAAYSALPPLLGKHNEPDWYPLDARTDSRESS